MAIFGFVMGFAIEFVVGFIKGFVMPGARFHASLRSGSSHYDR
jgi:hypothetical protein